MSRGAELRINAEYARLIQPFISTEKTRYYLNGFWVQPCDKGGAFIVATDGRTIAVFRDERATVTVPGIIKLSKTTLAACKAGKKETKRALVVEADTVSVYRNYDEEQGRGILVAGEEGVVIDGEFPNWRAVVPALPSGYGAASLANENLHRFQKIGRALRCYVADERSPVVVLSDREDFIGVVMPMVMDHRYPDWLPTVKQKAAAE